MGVPSHKTTCKCLRDSVVKLREIFSEKIMNQNVDYGRYFAKYLVFLINLIFVLCGFLLLYTVFTSESTYQYSATFSLLAVVLIAFAVPLFGCFAAAKESRSLIYTYVFVVLVLLIIQMYYAYIVSSSLRGVSLKTIQKMYKTKFDRYEINRKDEEFIDTVQSGMRCCGIDGPRDFIKPNDYNPMLPWSCCIQHDLGNKHPCSLSSYIFSQGCSSVYSEWLKSLVESMSIVGPVMAGLQLILVIAGIIFANSLYSSHIGDDAILLVS